MQRAATADGPVPVGLQEVAAGLDFPLYLTAPPGDSRLFIVEKGGAIRIVKDGSLLPTPFLDLSSLVSTGGEQGLLGLAFDPAYATDGRFVVHYTDVNGNTTVAAYRVSAGDPDQADPSSETVVLTAEQPFANHNGGQILFGPDGMLYIGLGDGGSGGDPGGRGQSLTDLLGDILRVDVASGTGYTVPARQPLRGADRRTARGLELRPSKPLAIHLRSPPPATSTSRTSARMRGKKWTWSPRPRARAGAPTSAGT